MKTNYTDALINEYDSELNEAGYGYRHSYYGTWEETCRKDFWSNAKKGVIDVDAFHTGYDKELKSFGLMDQFDADGMIKSKSSYGVFKKAAEAHPDSWAIKAALKFCGMRFWDNAKTVKEVKTEEDAAKEVEKQKRAEATSKTKTYITDHNAELVDLVKQIAMEAEGVDDILIKQAKANNLSKTADELTAEAQEHEVYYKTEAMSENVTGHDVSKCTVNFGRNDYDLKIYIGYTAICGDSDAKVPHIDDIHLYNIYLSSVTDYMDTNGESETFADSVRSAIANALAKKDKEYTESVSAMQSRVDTAQDVLDKVNKIHECNKNIIAAVARGEQPDKSVVDEIIATAHKCDKDRSDEYHSWASWSGDDGDSGLAYATETEKGIGALDRYMRNTHWDSNVGSFHGGSADDYIAAVAKLLDQRLSKITFVK